MLKIIQVLIIFSSLSAFAEIGNFHKVNDWVYRGAAPASSKDYEQLIKLGVKTVINLAELNYQVDRDERLWKAALKSTGLRGNFLREPLSWIVPPTAEELLPILREMTDPSLTPVFVHCTKGEDRTGLVVALYRIHAENWPREKAREEMLKYGFKKYLVGLVHGFNEYSDWEKLSD